MPHTAAPTRNRALHPAQSADASSHPAGASRRTASLSAALLLAAAAAAPLAAQQSGTAPATDTLRLERIVVTATRLPVSVANAPGAVTVLTASELEQRGARTLADALRTVPGVAVVQSAGPGAQTSVFMRGGESDYVQLLVDGVQLNDAGGFFDWAHVRLEDVERIEIVRGPVSVLYGSDAVSGVVQVFTRAGGAPRLTLAATGARGDKRAGVGGSFDTGSADASLTGSAAPAWLGGARAAYGFTAAHSRSNGLYEYNSDYDNTMLSGRLRMAGTRADAALTVRATENEFHFPTSGSGVVSDPNQFSVGDALTAGLDAGTRIGSRLELRLLATGNRRTGRTDDPQDSPDDGTSWNTVEQQRTALDVRANVFLPRSFVLTLGSEREWQDEQTAYESTSAFGTFADQTDESRVNSGFYSQLHGTVGPVALTAGGRMDDNEKFGTFRTGRLAASVQPVSGVRLHGAIGSAFKEPTFFEQFATGFTRGNPDLEPEETRSAEAGIEWSNATVSAGVVAFRQTFRNLIQYTGAPAPGTPNYSNIGRASAAGTEFTAELRTSRARGRASWSWTHTNVEDAGFGEDDAFQEGERLLRRPEHVLTLSADADVARNIRALLDVRAADVRDDLDFASFPATRVSIDGYVTTDAGLAWHAGSLLGSRADALELTARVRNLFDAQYEEIRSFPSPGRVLQLGVRTTVGL